MSFPRSAGVHKERGMCREKRTRTWETRFVPVGKKKQEGRPKQQVGKPDTIGGQISPHLYLRYWRRCSTLRRESRSHTAPVVQGRCGEGADRDTQLVKENTTGHAGSERKRANLTAGHSEEGK